MPSTRLSWNDRTTSSSRSGFAWELARNTAYPCRLATSSIPATTSATKGSVISVATHPTVIDRRSTRPRPIRLARYPCCCATFLMRTAVSAFTTGLSRRARETVECETPTRRAISLMETTLFISSGSRDHIRAISHRMRCPCNRSPEAHAVTYRILRECAASSTQERDHRRSPKLSNGPPVRRDSSRQSLLAGVLQGQRGTAPPAPPIPVRARFVPRSSPRPDVGERQKESALQRGFPPRARQPDRSTQPPRGR